MSTYKERYEERKKKRESQESGPSFKDRFVARKIKSGELDLETASKDISNRINTWFKNNENFVSNYNYRFKGFTGSYNDPYDSTINDWISNVTSQKSNFDQEASSIISWLDTYGDYVGGREWADSVKNALRSAGTQQSEILKNASEYSKYWSQWDSEDAYKRYQKISSIADMTSEQIKPYLTSDNPVAYIDDDGKEITWDSLYKSKYYKEFTGKEDFADKSKSGYAAYEADVRAGIEREEAAKKEEKWYEKIGRYLGDAGPDTTLPNAGFIQTTNDIRKDTSYMKPSNSWSQEQKDIYGYLYATDKGAAAEYAHYANELNNKASNEEKITAIENWATKNGLTGSLATLGSIAMMPMSLVDSLGSMIEYGERGFISTSSEPLPGQVSSAIRSAISETLNQKTGTLNEKIPVIGGKGWGDVYQLGTSIADSMISAYTQGSVGTFMVFFGSASASGMYEAKERGATDAQAVTLGVLNGLAEAAGEAFSVDKLLSLAGVDELKSFFGNVLLQAGIEASEEGFTSVLNNYADQLVMGDKSNFNVLVNYYMTEKKLSEEEAKRKAWADMANDLAYDVLGGFISGGVSAGFQTGVQTVIQNGTENAEAKDLYGTDVGALVGEALEIDPNNAFAQRMQAKVESGKNLSGAQINRLVNQNESAMVANDAASIQSAAESRLTELGERGDVKAIASALTKQVTGKRLTITEREAIKSSKYGERVANELNTENIKSGGYSSAWAEKIGTDRINAEEYGRMVAEMENEDSSATAPETEADTRQVTGKLPASKAEFESDTNVGDKRAQGPAVASEGLTEAREANGATYETAEAKDAQAGKVEASEGDHIREVTEMIDEEEGTVTLEAASAKYGAQAGAMVHTYTEGQDVAKYDAAYGVAYDMGKSGVNLSYAMNSEATAYLTEKQRELAYEAGTAASTAAAEAQDAKNKAAINGNTGRRKGSVRGEGVSISDLKATFNDTQGTAYKLLSTYAEATGVDIVLYKSEANADGRFEGAQGRFKWSEDTIYIDINAGLADIKGVNDLAKYTIMRTFAHEFTHFIEKWNPIWYNELRKVVFDTITAHGENVDGLIAVKMEQTGLDYEKVSREVVAEAMTDILPDANFVEELANNHKNIFQQLLAKLKEFLADLKAYFSSIGPNSSREANALKEQVGDSVKYVESVVKLFDKVAVEAVENYQMTVAVEEIAEATTTEATVSETETVEKEVTPEKGKTTQKSYLDQVLDKRNEKYNEIKQKYPDSMVIFKVEDHYEIIDISNIRIEADKLDSLIKATTKYKNVVLVQGDSITEYPMVSAKTATDEVNAEEVSAEVEAAEAVPVEAVTEEVAPEVDTRSLEEREKEYKKKYSSWLKRAIKQYVMHYGDTTFLSNGALGLKASEDMIGFARSEFAGMVYETNVPDQAKTALDNANTLLTEAPFEGTLKDNTPVYVFNVDGKQRVFDKKHLSKLDGNLLYIGDFTREAKIIKAVDADGNVVGFLLPMKVSYEVTNTKPSKLKSFSSKFQSQIKQEVKPNVEETGTVLPHRSDGERTSRLLAESQTEDVQGDGAERNPVDDAGERGGETRRDDNRPDAEGTRGGSGEGDSESGDLRRDDGLSAEKSSVTDEKLHEEVVQQIAEQSTEQPKGRNFVIGDSLDLPNGEKARYKANVEAIRLVKQLEAEGRYATEAEQVILSKYVGWGGLANAFDQRKSEWAKEYTELKELLSDEEYASARGSTLNAHFTDISVIKAMYDGLAGLGFEGGRLLEPSSGVGNFVGAMPAEMSAKVKSWTMVELDGITGLIAKYLYPNADVRIQGFEKANIPDNFMDVAISNVPFGNYAITDKAYPKKVTSAIHNYFFAKSLDKVRPGGIVMFITSSYTMNSKDETVRRYIMQRADLLGAIRLPDNAFKGNAGTEVVTDILVLKKRAANTAYAGEDFLEAPWTRLQNESYNGAYINSYFEAHPEMVLGTATMDGGMYRGGSLTYKALEGKGSLGNQIREAFKSIQGKMEYPATISRERTNFAVERASKKTKENGLVVRDGKVYQNRGGELIEQTVANGAAERITGMLEIRDAAKELMTYQQQGLKDSEIKKARTKLNKAYDAFVKKYGYINTQSNKNAIKDDPDKFSIFALENWDPDTKKATKADIFSKNTIAPNRTVTSAKDVAEGLIVSVNQTGGVDTALIARLTGKTEADVTRELIDGRKAFKNRNGALEAAEVYLSGNVRAKLRDAEALVPLDADYKNNVEALKAVIPADVGYQDIFVNAGTPWIPNSIYSDFAAYMLGGRNSEYRQDVDVTRNPETGNFTVELKSRYLKTNAANTQKWGTARRSFLDLFDAMLNSKSVVIKDKLDDGSFVINKDATAAANEKIENIQKEFQEWLWKDEARRTELATLYNETFNSIVTPKYNGDNLTVNGANAMKPLRPHQRDAVQRVISSGGNTLLAHKVGAGKTYEMAAAAMKLKELGLVKKPLFAVPKSLVAQWGNEFKDFFPTAKLLVAEASDFTAANRKVFMNRIANGEYDAVIVSYEQFEKLPMSDDYTRQLYQEQIDSVVAAIEEAKAEKGEKALSIKDLEKKRKSLQAKIDKLTDKAKDEDNIDFEQLGVDSLFVDEAHNFKNLFYTTSMTNVSGLGNKDGSKRAFDLYTKVRYLQQLNGGRGIVFATATPVMNSMSEMYIMQKYLQPDLMGQLGLSTFDAWAKQFGEVVNGVEIKPSGQGYRVKQSFSRFKNMSELQLLFRNFADVLTDIPGLKIPKMKGGKVNVVVCEPGQFQQDYMKELEKRADNIKNVDPSEDNMLKITSDGRKISYTQRMIDPSLPYEAGCKIYRCADNVIAAYNESKDIKGTQLIFLDMATPKGKSNNETATEDLETDNDSAQLYDDLKARLRTLGIPAKEIAFIHEADTDAKKKKLFADVNDGKVRVLIGSTGKMGVGMNAQKRVVAIHHLDAPWRPGDVEQRNGRAFRQGNINDEVECFTYVTEGSFDARLWDILERKQNFINQIMNGESVGREAEDTGEVTLSAAEVKALASGSPLIMEQVQLDTDIKKLESLYREHKSDVYYAKERLMRDAGEIAKYENYIAAGKADLSARVDTYSEGKFSIKVGNTTYTDKKEAGVALMAAATANAVDTAYTTIGSFAGFDVRVIKTHEGIKGLLSGKQGYSFKTYPESTTFMLNHISAVAESIEEKIKLWEHSLAETQTDMAEQEKLIATPFAKQAELDTKRARYNEVMEILNPKEEQSLDSVADDTVQEQSRAYLGEQKYSYEWFTSKPDMLITALGETVPDNRADVVLQAKKNAASVGKINKDGSVSVYVKDIDNDIVLSTNGLKHGLDRRFDVNAPVTLQAGEILKNSIRINELTPQKEEADASYVMIGAAKAGEDIYIVRSVINRFSSELASMDVLYAVNAKKENQLRSMRPGFQRPVTDSQESTGKLSPSITAHGAGYFTDSTISIAHLLEFVNSFFPDILPEDVLRHFGHEARPDGVIGKDALYQQRTNTLTDREVLQMAAGDLDTGDLTEGERDALHIFKDRLTKLETLQEERAEQGRLYKEQQFGAKVDREAAAATLNRMHVLDDKIKAANADVLTVENKEVLGRVLKKARKVVETEQRAHDNEIFKRYVDRTKNAAAIKKYRERIKKDVDELTSWVIKPNNKDIVKHIPDALKNSVIPFLTSIDFTSKQQLRGGEATKADEEFVKRLNGLNAALKKNIDINGLYSGYNDLPPHFMDKLQDFINGVQTLVGQKSGEFVINKMTSEELKELASVVKVLKAYITQMNKFHANAMYSHVYEAGDNTIDSLAAMQSDGGNANGVSNFVLWQQMRPAYAFERFGEGGKAIYDGLRRGQAQLAFNTKKIVEFTEEAYSDKEVKAWEKEIKTIKLGGHTVKMRISDIMSFYELSKQPDSLRHMLGEGMRVATYTVNGKKISDNGHSLTEIDIAAIVNTLTDRQKEVADALQKFMAEQGGAWGNYVSLKRFGEEQFTNEQYFPINSDGRHLQATADEAPSATSLYALLNMSFTKSRNELANNRIIIYSIFDVFANHMASMAQYNAMALPVLDAIKWINYEQKTEDSFGNRYVKDGVREQMDRVYGVSEETRPGRGNGGYAQSFVLGIIKAFNGTEAQGIPTDTFGMNATRRYNMAQVAYNFRVVAQQPLAITRAALLIDYRSIIKGMKLSPAAIKNNIAEMQKYSGIAAWKSLGFYDTNISRGLTDTIKHSSTVIDKIGDVGMWGAEKADLLTWAGIWSACKEEVVKKQGIKPGADGFYEAVTQLFEDVIYKTQVVDSVLTKNEFMRSKGFFARAIGSFMSEPTTTASMVINAYDKYHMDMQRGMTKQQAWQNNSKLIGRTLYVYGITQALLAAVTAVMDAWRDDDEYESFPEKWIEAFGGNLVDELMPFNKLPILKEVYEVVKELLAAGGWDTYGQVSNLVFAEIAANLVKGWEIISDKIHNEDTNYEWYAGIYKLLQAASGISGLPLAAATREIIAAWNNTVGAMAPSLKVKTYDAGEMNEIKYAYADGYLTDEEATELLLERGLVDNEDEAYFTIKGWEAGEGYSRYDAIYDAVLNGGDFDAAMAELTSRGYDEEDVIGRVTSQIGSWYYDDESDIRISKQQAISMLEKYTDMTDEEITKKVNRWSSKVVTGIAYDDIGDEFLEGNITASRASEMFMRYGSMTKEEAGKKVAVLQFVKDYPQFDINDVSFSMVEGFSTYGESAGIDVDVFYDVWKFNSGAKADVDKNGKAISGSKKEKVLDYIDSLPLSKTQKDNLYYALGWAESTIREAPWR